MSLKDYRECASQYSDTDLFRNDKYLAPLLNKLDNYNVISFDVFDTLLFRMVYEPADVFMEAGRSVCAEISECRELPPGIFRNLRIEAERRARAKAAAADCYEITLEQIYDEFKNFDSSARFMAIELESERVCCYLNPNMYAFMRHCHNLGKRIALISDSYLSAAQLRVLLEHTGLDFSLVELFIVSSEYGETKHIGILFKRLLEHFNGISPECILHIGDNWLADVRKASAFGIHTAPYPVVPDSCFDPFGMERAMHPYELGELQALRSLALCSAPAEFRENDTLEWFKIGCATFGPLYSLFAEWVIEQALAYGARRVLCFMRDGELLSELIGRAAKVRGVDMFIMPAYFSRRSTAIAGLSVVDEAVIEERLKRTELSLDDLFGIFYLDINETPFAEFSGTLIRDTEALENIREYLTNASTLELINSRVRGQRDMLIEYFDSLTEGEKAVTVDLGFHGSIQNSLNKALRIAGREDTLLHLVMMGYETNAPLLLDGVRFIGWLGYCGENQQMLSRILERALLIEAVCIASVGTTLAYRKEAGRIQPVLGACVLTESERRCKQIIYHGIIHFQKYWFMLRSAKPMLTTVLLQQKNGFLQLMLRLLEKPVYEEAKRLGCLSYEDNILSTITTPVCSELDYTVFDAAGSYRSFLAHLKSTGHFVPWPEGITENRIPDYFWETHLNASISALKYTIWQFYRNYKYRSEKVALYGAGTAGQWMAEMARLYNFPLAFIVDSNEELWGEILYGFDIVAPSQAIGKADIYLISSERNEEEIIKNIIGIHNGTQQPKIIRRTALLAESKIGILEPVLMG